MVQWEADYDVTAAAAAAGNATDKSSLAVVAGRRS